MWSRTPIVIHTGDGSWWASLREIMAVLRQHQ